jgi:hypothetical protein
MTTRVLETESPRRFQGPFFWLALLVFVGLTSLLALNHEMWRDEVRAFSVAINATSIPALLDALRVEGHPSLWYLVLAAGHAAWQSPLVLPVAAMVISTLAAAVILRHSPFPVGVRLLIVFGVFMVVEQTVMARNYGIGILFLAAACAAFPARRARPLPAAVFLALMANTSVHAALASLIIGFVWLFDLLDRDGRKALLSPSGIAAFVIAIGGITFAFWTARPAADMSYAFSLRTLDGAKTLRAIFSDPGWGLSGYRGANVGAVNELPWVRLGIDPDTASRWVVNICMLAIAWGLRKSKRFLAAFIIAIAGFQVVFRTVYTGGLRHEGILFFLFIALGWLAIAKDGFTRESIRRVSLGFLPLIAVQAAAMPFMARRVIQHPESSSKAYAAAILGNPRYRDAILASDPDYMMEALPYYVPNAVYMPRQREFHHRVYFSAQGRRQLDLSLQDLVGIADSVAAAKCRIVLLAIGYPSFADSVSGVEGLGYKPAVFRWDPESRSALLARGAPILAFRGALSDENYQVFELAPTKPCQLER